MSLFALVDRVTQESLTQGLAAWALLRECSQEKPITVRKTGREGERRQEKRDLMWHLIWPDAGRLSSVNCTSELSRLEARGPGYLTPM